MLERTHPHFSDRLCRYHITQHRCGYCQSEYTFEGRPNTKKYSAATLWTVASVMLASEYPHSNLKSTIAVRNPRSEKSGTVYITHLIGSLWNTRCTPGNVNVKLALMWLIRQWTLFLCHLPCRCVQCVFYKIHIHQIPWLSYNTRYAWKYERLMCPYFIY